MGSVKMRSACVRAAVLVPFILVALAIRRLLGLNMVQAIVVAVLLGAMGGSLGEMLAGR